MKDFLQYLTDEGFVAIHYWYKEDGLIDGRVVSMKQYEPICIETDQGDKEPDITKLIWRTPETVYTYTTTSEFFKKYGKLVKDYNQAYLAGNKWIKELKEIYATYK